VQAVFWSFGWDQLTHRSHKIARKINHVCEREKNTRLEQPSIRVPQKQGYPIFRTNSASHRQVIALKMSARGQRHYHYLGRRGLEGAVYTSPSSTLDAQHRTCGNSSATGCANRRKPGRGPTRVRGQGAAPRGGARPEAATMARAAGDLAAAEGVTRHLGAGARGGVAASGACEDGGEI
jgi:hypothetical protein